MTPSIGGNTTMCLAYPPWVRVVLAALALWRWFAVWAVSALVLLATDPPITPPVLVRLSAVGIAAPFVLEQILRWRFRARTSSDGDTLVLEFRQFRLGIPRERLRGIEPWRVPLPAPGLSLLLADGTRLRERIEVADPYAWAQVHGLPWETPASVLQQASVALAHSRAQQPRWRWYHYATKFAVFALLPAALLFQVHQHIAYGSLWGEYYLRGLSSYLRTWCVYYGTVVIDLLLYAGLWRSATEVALWLGCMFRPDLAPALRSLGERACSLGYYVGVIALLALRFLG
jgi:apolipoprotein N-acyltransferase